MNCPVCRQPMSPLTLRGEPRKVCSRTCAGRVGHPKRRDVYAEEVEDLRSYGSSPEDILTALGLKPGTLSRALYREGRADLAHPFDRIAWAQRKRPRRSRAKTHTADHAASRTTARRNAA